MQFEVIDKQQVSDEVKRYLSFRFAPLWEALKSAEAIKVPVTDGQTVDSLRMSLCYAAKVSKQKVRCLASTDRKSVIVVKDV